MPDTPPPDTPLNGLPDLFEDMAGFYDDPLGFVLYAYPWGEGSLAAFEGPDEWQRDYLSNMGKIVKARGFDGVNPVSAVQMAVASGHGIGKSALVAWLVNWIMSTRPHCKGIVTANTAPQLETKTWAEIIKWTKRSITAPWFDYTTSKGSMRLYHRDHKESWRCDAITCREENSESFAGQHAANSTPFYIFDEASAIPNAIWDVAEGGLTDGEPIWCVFGNPTRNSGRFHDCFHRLKHRWNGRQIDSRTCALPNKQQINDWMSDYGEDSDFFKIRVRGLFPSSAHSQFIDTALVTRAMNAATTAPEDRYAPLIVGVDVARFGQDQTVIAIRKGLDGRFIAPLSLKHADTMQVAAHVARIACGEHPTIRGAIPDAILIDGIGIGAGVVDRLRQLGFQHIIDVNSASQASDKSYANLRAHMYGRFRQWLMDGGILPDMPELLGEMTLIEYGFDKSNRLLLESKDMIRKRGLGSPDIADAYALTFAEMVAPKSAQLLTGSLSPSAYQHEYDIFKDE